MAERNSPGQVCIISDNIILIVLFITYLLFVLVNLPTTEALMFFQVLIIFFFVLYLESKL